MPPLKTYSPHNEFSANNCNRNNGNTSSNATDNNSGLNNGVNTTNNSTTMQRTTIPSYANAQYPFKVLSNLNLLREQSRFCDVEIVAGGATYNAHRAVLSSASAYFEAMFRPELGLNEGKQKSVILHTIDGEIMNILLDFIYTGRCEITQVNQWFFCEKSYLLQLLFVYCLLVKCSRAFGRRRYVTTTRSCRWLL